MRRLSQLFLTSACSLLATASGGAPLPEEEREAFFGAIEVQLVELEVVVTDRRGEVITDLERDDFQVEVDRQPVAITHFQSPGERAPARPGESRRPVPTVDGLASAMAEEAGATESALIVYVDNLSLRPADRGPALRSVAQFLSRSAPLWNRVMVVSYDRALEIRQPFTSDLGAAQGAVLALTGARAAGRQQDVERREVLRMLDTAETAELAAARIRQFAEQVRGDLELSGGALMELIRSLGGVPGRKLLLHVSSGLEMQPAADLVAAAQGRFGGELRGAMVGGAPLTRFYQQITGLANSSGVTLYTLDATGLYVGAASDWLHETGGSAPLVESTYRTNRQSSLILLAGETGGQAIMNTNNPTPGLERMARDERLHYALGFAPPHGADGRFHGVRVRVARRGLEVRHRAGYRLHPVEDRMASGVRSVLTYGLEANPLAARLESGRAEPRADGLLDIALWVEIPWERMTLVPLETVRRAHMRLFVEAQDSQGGRSELVRKEVPLELTPEEWEMLRESPFRYHVSLQMRPGPHAVGVAVQDVLGGQASFLRLDLEGAGL